MELRNSFLIFLFLFSLGGYAQGRAVHYFEAEQPLDVMAQRSMNEAVLDMDPNAEVLFHFDDQSLVQINANPSVSATELREVILAQGIALREGTPVVPVQPQVNTTPEGRPFYVVSGDDAADRANYQQAVEQWNAANPADRIEIPLSVGDDQ